MEALTLRRFGRQSRTSLASVSAFGRNLIRVTLRGFLSKTATAPALQTLLRKEVIQPQVLLQLPCYDFTPITKFTIESWPLAVTSPSSSAPGFRDVTGGVYKARERIHRIILIHDY